MKNDFWHVKAFGTIHLQQSILYIKSSIQILNKLNKLIKSDMPIMEEKAEITIDGPFEKPEIEIKNTIGNPLSILISPLLFFA